MAVTKVTTIPAGTRVEISYELIAAGERAATVPADTAATPYVVRVRGTLLHDARAGGAVTVRTASGRHREGTLVVVAPSDDHSFGRSHRALLAAVAGIQRLLEEHR